MTERTVTLPHFWGLLDALPIALLYKENTKAEVFANVAALKLLQLPANKAVLSVSDLQHIKLLCPAKQQAFNLLHNPLLQALSGTALQQPVALEHCCDTLLLHSTSVALSFTLHNSILVTLQPINNIGDIPVLPQAVADTSELEEALAFDKLMSLISTQLINVQDNMLDQHIEDALAAVGEFCHADRSYVFQFNNDVDEMSNTHEWVRAGISTHKAQLQQIPEAALPYFCQQLKRDLVFAVNEVAKLPAEAAAEKQEFDAEDIQSVLCCAMLADDKLIGFVGCDMVSRQRNWTHNDLRRMKLVGEMIANTLQNVRYRHSLQNMQQQLLQANLELQQQASQDGLTAIANRRQLDTSLQNELQRCARNSLPMGLLLLDIDRFKLYNDHYGHQAGDDALKQIAQLLHQQTKRQGELAARYGGEEFALILPGSDIHACKKMAEQVQLALAKLAIKHSASDIASNITASIGVVSMVPDKTNSSSDFIKAADQALYQAKANGRNCLVIHTNG
ncbi:sensor domain-containing diguanylate cyclase [Rheinheimera maricola]|uniref:diguanylate cyclase n=1 Tax=Rheinheimera maricola TaxID=2793282 RepID=A0ABS7X4A7_9GAMM|nr:sensor domain-containing diguanylate cyclase [Rheinheimera maricola]MBZ9610376.1 sensor domain-containing diguanylate cyclase [Rheinheimera maricola]